MSQQEETDEVLRLKLSIKVGASLNIHTYMGVDFKRNQLNISISTLPHCPPSSMRLTPGFSGRRTHYSLASSKSVDQPADKRTWITSRRPPSRPV